MSINRDEIEYIRNISKLIERTDARPEVQIKGMLTHACIVAWCSRVPGCKRQTISRDIVAFVREVLRQIEEEEYDSLY